MLRAAGLHFRRQVSIGRFIADFACLKQRIVIELDGGQHSADLMVASDQARDEELARRRFRVLRFWNAEIDENLDGVVETILAAVQGGARDGSERVAVRGAATSAPVPTPTLPSGEGGD
jgi:very-short-patch-repair endonuclease